MNDDELIQRNFPNKDAEYLSKLFEKAERILIKKLSNNDRDWARFANKHQAGVYMPREQRDGGFFDSLLPKERERVNSDEIREVFFKTAWPQFGNIEKHTRLVNYSSKGSETHMTRLPKDAFAELMPASYLVMGRLGGKGAYYYECLTIDSESEEADFLQDLFSLGPDFLIGEFIPENVRAAEREKVLDFSEQVVDAWLRGSIAGFASEYAVMPTTTELARMALQQFLELNRLSKLDPFSLDAPGDVLREISRNIEWNLFREYQHRERAVEVIRLILGDRPQNIAPRDIIHILIERLPEIDAVMLSASQQRKSRAGYSYEHHIEAMLLGGNIPFEKQVVIESKKRPDFILPFLKFIDGDFEASRTGLILSAKTTLRERWKQVEREKKGRRLFLTTVDENIAGNAIEDMASIGIQLVIPESLLKSKETEYEGRSNVISFKEFCETHVKPFLNGWRKL